jgi:hypothetical protein
LTVFPVFFASIPYQKGPEIHDRVPQKADTIPWHFEYDLPEVSSGGKER